MGQESGVIGLVCKGVVVFPKLVKDLECFFETLLFFLLTKFQGCLEGGMGWEYEFLPLKGVVV